MVGDDKGRENLGDYGDFGGIFFDFFLILWIFCGGFWEHSEQLGALGVWGEGGSVGVWGRSEVVRRRCSALLVLRREGGWGF